MIDYCYFLHCHSLHKLNTAIRFFFKLYCVLHQQSFFKCYIKFTKLPAICSVAFIRLSSLHHTADCLHKTCQLTAATTNLPLVNEPKFSQMLQKPFLNLSHVICRVVLSVTGTNWQSILLRCEKNINSNSKNLIH